MEIIHLIIGLTTLIWAVYTQIETLSIKYNIYDKIEKYMCLKCITFWTVLIITFNPLNAGICSFLAYLIDKNNNTKL